MNDRRAGGRGGSPRLAGHVRILLRVSRDVLRRLVEAGRNDRHATLALHRLLVDCSEDDLGFFANCVLDDLDDLMNVAESEVVAASDVDQNPSCP